MERIYLDYAASAPLSPEAKRVIQDFLKDMPVGNPSSLHTEGRRMQDYLDKAHTTLAAVFGVQPTEVVFTSGATEGNALAIRGVLQAWRLHHEGRPHVVMSAIEHPSWRAVAQSEDADITLVDVSQDGVVSAQDMISAIRPNTALVGCMYVNNELGTVQPIAEIGKAIQALRDQSLKSFPVFHVDAVQAFPYLNTHHGHLHSDIVTISGHKYGALGGSGALLIKKQTPFSSFLKGGSQEWGYRAGTENVLGALTLAAVIEWNDTHRLHVAGHVEGVQKALESALRARFTSLEVLGANADRAPHITYIWLPEVIDEHFVHKLDLAGVAASSGSACSSGAALPSSTLLAMGYAEHEAYGGLRLSYGRFTTHHDVQAAVTRLASVITP